VKRASVGRAAAKPPPVKKGRKPVSFASRALARIIRVPATSRRATLSDDTRDLEQSDELEEQDEVEAHVRLDANAEPDDEVEAHIRIN
jgi:hypothetical protein